MFEHCSELEGSINYYYVQENFTVKPKNFMCSDIVLKYANIQQFGRYKTEHMLFVICVTVHYHLLSSVDHTEAGKKVKQNKSK